MYDRRFALVLGLLMLAAVSASAQPGSSPAGPGSSPRVEVTPATHEPVYARALGVHGDTVAFASPANETIEIRTANLTSGDERLVTSISTRYNDALVHELAYDGRWIAWIDDRFGNWEVFAVDTQSGNLTRITKNASDDRHVDVSQGRIVWGRDGGLHMASVTTGEQVILHPKIGRAPQPAIEGERMAWVSTNGSATAVNLETPSVPTPERLGFVPEGGVISLDLGGDRVIWTELHMEIEGQEVEEIRGSVVRSTTFSIAETQDGGPTFQTGGVENHTRMGEVGLATAHGDNVAWIYSQPGAPGAIEISDLASNTSVSLSSAVGLDSSDRYLVFASPDQPDASLTSLYAMEWSTLATVGSSAGTIAEIGGSWWLGGAGVALLLIAVFWSPIQRSIRRLVGSERGP